MGEEKKIYNLKALKIIAVVMIFLTTLFMTYVDIDIISSAVNGNIAGIALAYAIIVILLGALLYGINLIYSLVVLIISVILYKKGSCEKKVVIFFLVTTVAPIILYALAILIPRNFII